MSNVSMVDGHIDYDEMTPKKALEILNDVEFSEKYQGKQEYADMLLFCKESIEKQIPKKPLDIEETKYKVFYKCPVCGTVHTNEWCGTDWKLPFCSICGQALDWSDAE